MRPIRGSHLLKKFFIKSFIFCAAIVSLQLTVWIHMTHKDAALGFLSFTTLMYGYVWPVQYLELKKLLRQIG